MSFTSISGEGRRREGSLLERGLEGWGWHLGQGVLGCQHELCRGRGER